MPDAPTRVMFRGARGRRARALRGSEPLARVRRRRHVRRHHRRRSTPSSTRSPEHESQGTETSVERVPAIAPPPRVRRAGMGTPTPRRSRPSASWTTRDRMENEEPDFEPRDPEPLDAFRGRLEDIAADLADLAAMRVVFSAQGVKGVVIACQDCGSNHFYEWELLRDNLEHMLKFGRAADARARVGHRRGRVHPVGLRQGLHRRPRRHGARSPTARSRSPQCPWCETPFHEEFRFCPSCGSELATIRLYRELLDRGIRRARRQGDARPRRVRAVLSSPGPARAQAA